MNNKVSAIIVTYNRLNLLKKCLSCVLHQSYKLSSIFVINNDSTDGTKEYLTNLNNSIIKPINMKRNLNGAGGFSTGVKLAFEYSDSDYFWLMDDDTLPRYNSLKALINGSMKLNNKFGFLCSNVRWLKNNDPCNMPTVRGDKWSKFSSSYLVGVQEATFVSFLVPRIMVKKYGIPMAEAVIWGDDTEYSSRLSKFEPSYFVGNSIVDHASSSPDLSYENVIYEHTNDRIARYKYMYRNRLYVERKYRSWRSLLKWMLRFILIFIKIPFRSKDRRIKRLYYTLCGFTLGLFFNPKIKFLK